MRNAVRRRAARAAATLILPPLMGAVGCVTGSLATSTGPQSPGMPWSTASRQSAYVGETVSFEFVLQDWLHRHVDPAGSADYCVAMIDSERIEASADIDGRFHFSCTFSNTMQDDARTVRVTAYRQRGGRDFMKVRDQWMQSDSPYEMADRRVAVDSIVLGFYDRPIEIRIPRLTDELDAMTGVMRILKPGGTPTSVFVDRPHRPGFTLTGPDGDGHRVAQYVPTSEQLNPTGITEVVFQIEDIAGKAYEHRLTIDTP